MSLSPDFCVRQTETVFTKLGPWSLVFAKFLPGLSLISVAMAGVVNMSALAFFLLNVVGSLLFVIVFVALGVIFEDAITSVLATLTELGTLGISAIVVGLALYSLFKWWRRMLFILDERILMAMAKVPRHEFVPIEVQQYLEILGSPDDLKFRSCLTLFCEAASSNSDLELFAKALAQFYRGQPDDRTLELLR